MKRIPMILTALLPLLCACSGYRKGLVDLGLSVRWNGCNVGAQAPHEAGSFYAWGEQDPKDSYLFEDCATESMDIPALREAGYIDKRGHLTPAHDAATANAGPGLRMPTRAEAQELIDNCTWEWQRYRKVWGYRITSKKNGHRIFLPAAGYHGAGDTFYSGEAGYYWTSTVEGSHSGHAHDLFCSPHEDIICSYSGRYDGLSVRPVENK